MFFIWLKSDTVPEAEAEYSSGECVTTCGADKAPNLYTIFIWTAVLLQIIGKLELTATLWL